MSWLGCSMAFVLRNCFKLQLKHSSSVGALEHRGPVARRLRALHKDAANAGLWVQGFGNRASHCHPLSLQHTKAQGAVPHLHSAEGRWAAAHGHTTIPCRAEPTRPTQRWVPGCVPPPSPLTAVHPSLHPSVCLSLPQPPRSWRPSHPRRPPQGAQRSRRRASRPPAACPQPRRAPPRPMDSLTRKATAWPQVSCPQPPHLPRLLLLLLFLPWAAL